MPKAAHKVVVIGHRNPDTDSICSAIAYAELKNKTSSLVCEPRRAGRMNQETEFVLKKFGVTPPRMCTDVNPKIRDVDFREMPGINGSTSLRKAWEIMRDKQIDTLPITDADNELLGLITVKDIATANMDVFDTEVLAKSRTSYKNILETLGGTMVVGDENAVCTTGHIKIGTATPEMLESAVEKGDIVILTNRYESQLCAIEKEASLLINPCHVHDELLRGTACERDACSETAPDIGGGFLHGGTFCGIRNEKSGLPVYIVSR